MFELSMSKDEVYGNAKRGVFQVRLIDYGMIGTKLFDMCKASNVTRGVYIKESDIAPDIGIDKVLEALNQDAQCINYPIVIFDNIYIDREMTKTERDGKCAIEKFCNTDSTDDEFELRLDTLYRQVITFYRGIKLLKNKELVREMLPVDVNSIAFIEMQDTEGDFILSHNAELVDTAVIGDNVFNIYKLW